MNTDRLDDLLNNGFEDGLEGVIDAETGLFALVIQIVRDYLVRGNLVSDETDFRVLRAIEEAVLQAVRDSGYVDTIDDFVPLIDDIATETTNLTVLANERVRFNRNVVNLTQEKNIAIEELVTALNGADSIKTNLSNPIRSIIYQAIQSNATLEDAEALLRPLIIGDSARGGLLARYYRTIAIDALNGWSGTVQDKIASTYGLIDFMYTGSTITTTRPQCSRWISNYNGLLIKEVLERELQEARRSIRTRTSRFSGYSLLNAPSAVNFGRVRGGHRCRHLAISFLATEEEAEQAIRLYNSTENRRVTLKYQEQRAS